MPVPLNAAVEVTRSWLTKRLGYHVDDTIPVRPSSESVKATTPMDIDLICTHPSQNEVTICLGDTEYKFPRSLLVEIKGWFDYGSASSGILSGLSSDMKLMNGNVFIPAGYSKKKHGLNFTFLKEEFISKAKEIFGTEEFARVLVCPDLKESTRIKIKKEPILQSANKKGIFIIELSPMIEDLIRFCREKEAKDYLRRNFVLELIHLLDVSNQLVNTKGDEI